MDSADTYRPHARERSISRRRRSRSPRRRRSYTRSRSRSRGGYRRIDRRSRSPLSSRLPSRSYEDRAAAKEQMMQTIRDSSQQDRRVYIGNLSYDVKWHHLKDFMRQAGEVLFADVLLLPNGMSKGCGIVEYATRDQAQHAVNTLSNQNLMGRLVYVREDREPEPRFSQPASGARGNYDSGLGRGGQGGGSAGGSHGGSLSGGRQLYISNLPYNVGWQDLKDLFRQAAHTGSVFRADVHVAHDGRAKGSGVVAFETAEDARNAISQFNGYEWQGRVLEVREDRFAGFGGGTSRGGYGGFGGRGGYGGRSFGGRGGSGSTYSSRSNVGGGYNSHGGAYDANAADMPSNSFTDSATGGGDRGPIIYVRNLPWSTSNDDLIELFTTIGKVERAEIQYELNGRSRGTGVVEFDNVENADTAIAKFTGYQYGGRPLGLSYVKYTDAGDEDGMDVQKSDELAQDHVM